MEVICSVLSKQDKSIGIIKQINTMLEDLCFGLFYFEVVFILRDSLFLSSILTNCEAWYEMTNQEVEKKIVHD